MPRRDTERPDVADDEARLIEAWISHAGDRGRDTFWAWNRVTDLVFDQPEEGWPLLLRIIERSPDPQLGWVGAGPLETLLAEHGAAFGARVAEQARRDPRFRACLSAAWVGRGDVPAEAAAVLERVMGGGFFKAWLNRGSRARPEPTAKRGRR